MDKRRYLAVSDFHLTRGRFPAKGVWAATEDFFADDEFRRFLEYFASDQVPTTLIINGDLIDFLQILVSRDDSADLSAAGIQENEIDWVYGLRCTETTATYQIDQAISGHSVLFQSLARFVSSENNRVIFLKGNHDVQLFWPAVQEKIGRRLEGFVPENERRSIHERVQFLPWCYYVPGLLYVEHGNQYEYTTSFENFLRPVLPFEYKGVPNQIELDLSSLLVRYLTNRVEPVNPLADNIRPLSRYWEWVWNTHPLLFILTFGSAFRYVLKAFQKARRTSRERTKLKDAYASIASENKQLIQEEARRFEPDDVVRQEKLNEAFQEIAGMRVEPTLAQGAWKFLWTMLRTPILALVWLLVLYLFATIVPPLLFPEPPPAGTTFWEKVMDNLLFALRWLERIALTIVFGALLIWIRQVLRKRKSRLQAQKRRTEQQKRIADQPVGPDDLQGLAIPDMRVYAAIIARRLSVKYITFGHTHYADIHALENGSWYFNTGTWMAIIAEQEQLYRELRQFSFLKIEAWKEREEERAQLLFWDPANQRPKPVVVVDTADVSDDAEDNIIKFLFGLFKAK